MPWKESSVVDERLRFVGRLLDGESMSEVCEEFGTRGRPATRSSTASRSMASRRSSTAQDVRCAPPTSCRCRSSGQKLGIKEVDECIWLVSFMHYDLGYIDLEQRTLQTIDNPLGPGLSPMS